VVVEEARGSSGPPLWSSIAHPWNTGAVRNSEERARRGSGTAAGVAPQQGVSALGLHSRFGPPPTLVRPLRTLGAHAVSPGGASSAPLASRDGTPANRRLPLRPPCGEGVSACDAKGFAALPFGTSGRRTPGHAAPRHVGSRLAFSGISGAVLRSMAAPRVRRGALGVCSSMGRSELGVGGAGLPRWALLVATRAGASFMWSRPARCGLSSWARRASRHVPLRRSRHQRPSRVMSCSQTALPSSYSASIVIRPPYSSSIAAISTGHRSSSPHPGVMSLYQVRP